MQLEIMESTVVPRFFIVRQDCDRPIVVGSVYGYLTYEDANTALDTLSS
jgi:urease beta subunit